MHTITKPFSGYFFAIQFILYAFFVSNLTAAEIIVNSTVPFQDYSVQDARAIFTMHKRFWSNNKPIKVYVLSDNNLLHKDFIKKKLNMFPHQVRRAWDRMTYSGTGSAPVELDTEHEMIEKIANTPDSIGYLSSKPNNENIRSFELH